MAEAQAGHSNAQQDDQQQQGGEQRQAEGDGEQQQQQQQQGERTYTQAELDRILGKVRKNARYLGRKEAEAELVRQGATPRQAEQAVDRQQEKPKEAPKREDFDNYEDFLVAKADYAGRQASREEREASEKTAREKTVAEQRQKTDREFKKHAEAVMVDIPDFAEVIESADNVMITEAMGEAIKEAGAIGPRILYHLVQNPDEADRISQLPRNAQVREIGKLEARIEAELKAKKKAKPQGEEGDEEEKEGDAREDESDDADGKGKGKDDERGDDGRFKSQEKGSRKAPDPIEPGSGRSANQDRGPNDKDSDAGWFAKRLAQEKAERARQRGK